VITQLRIIMLNKNVFKRWSTWLNYIAMIMSASMSFVPQIGLAEEMSARVMLCFTIVISVSQKIKQGGKNATTSND